HVGHEPRDRGRATTAWRGRRSPDSERAARPRHRLGRLRRRQPRPSPERRMSIEFVPRFTPNPDGLTAEFYGHLAAGTLALQRCDACHVWRRPPRILCGQCGSSSWQWTPTSGRGCVYTWTVTHQMLVPPFADDLPYAVVVVE